MSGHRQPVVALMFAVLGACSSRAAMPRDASGLGGSGAGGVAMDGRGGNAGAGGTSGTGAGGVATAPGTWLPADSGGECPLEVADVTKLSLSALVWTSCGVGCLQSPAAKLLPDDDQVYAVATVGRIEGELVTLSMISTSGLREVMATRRFPDGALLGAIRHSGTTVDNYCVSIGAGDAAPRLMGVIAPDGKSVTTGYLMKSGSYSWAQLNVDGVSTMFENDLGWGIGSNDGTVRTRFPADSGTIQTIDRGGYQSDSSAARRELVVYTIAPDGSDTVIRAWEPNMPARTLVAQDQTDIPRVALSETNLVWVGSHGPQRRSGLYTAAELYWTTWPAGRANVNITAGPSLPTPGAVMNIQTWGDYAAAFSSGSNTDGNSPVIFVVRLSDKRLWQINPRPGHWYQSVSLVSSTEVVVTEADKLTHSMERLLRFDLAHLDDLARAW